MGFWSKKESELRTEEFFYNYLKNLRQGEMINLIKALVMIMKEMNTLNMDAKNLSKPDDKDRREVS